MLHVKQMLVSLENSILNDLTALFYLPERWLASSAKLKTEAQVLKHRLDALAVKLKVSHVADKPPGWLGSVMLTIYCTLQPPKNGTVILTETIRACSVYSGLI